MNLLKNDDSAPKKINSISVVSWPVESPSNGVGLSVKDGWRLGVGFGLAMTIAIPLILILLSCVIGVGLTILGTSLTTFLGG